MRKTSLIAALPVCMMLVARGGAQAEPIILSPDGPGPLRIAAKQVAVWQEDGVAIFSDAEFLHGDTQMRCQSLVVRFDHDTIKQLECEPVDRAPGYLRYRCATWTCVPPAANPASVTRW
jgi:hypothetical protein